MCVHIAHVVNQPKTFRAFFGHHPQRTTDLGPAALNNFARQQVADLLSGEAKLIGTANVAGAVVRRWRLACEGH